MDTRTRWAEGDPLGSPIRATYPDPVDRLGMAARRVTADQADPTRLRCMAALPVTVDSLHTAARPVTAGLVRLLGMAKPREPVGMAGQLGTVGRLGTARPLVTAGLRRAVVGSAARAGVGPEHRQERGALVDGMSSDRMGRGDRRRPWSS